MSSIDGAALVFLGLFGVWGALHGALRQSLGLLVIVTAFPLASTLSGAIEPAVAKVATLPPEGEACAAWVVAWFGVVVVGGVLLHLFGRLIDRARLGGRADALFGATVGLLKGILLLALLVHGVLGWHTDRAAPAVVSSLRTSRTAEVAARLEREVEPALRLPFPVVVRVERIHRRMDTEPRP